MSDIERVLGDLRRQVAALPKWDKRSAPGGFHVNRADVLALIDIATEGSADHTIVRKGLVEAIRAVTDDGYDHPDGCSCEGHERLRAALEPVTEEERS